MSISIYTAIAPVNKRSSPLPLLSLKFHPDAVADFIFIDMGTFYRARWLLLDNGELAENGALVVTNDLITSVGPRGKVKRQAGDRIVNLGDALLLPGLINLRTNLEENVVRGAIPQADETLASFSAKKNTRIKQAAEETLLAGIRLEIRELLAEGVTTVLDSSARGLSPRILATEPIRSWVLHEASADDLYEEEHAIDKVLTRITSCDKRIGAAVGPHALFSLTPQLQRKLIEFAAAYHYLWAAPIAESAEELQAFSERKGDLYFHITRKKPWPFGDTTLGPMHAALTQNLIPNGGICFHCNYASGHELSLLATKRVSVVSCFRYSEMLGHKRFPIDVARNRRVPMCLGTEGIAPVGELSLFDELFAFKNAYPHLSARELLRWVTQNPATALRMGDKLGSLTEGKFADVIAVRFSHAPGDDLLEELIVSDVEMALVMVNGQEVIADY